jgi:hypothetical protein
MKAGIITPVYLSVSWVLTVSYQLLTDTAVRSIGTNIGLLNPSLGLWINSNIQTIVFVYAFTWIFVLSSVIPQAILGKERSVIAQYIVVLTLSLLALFMPYILLSLTGIDITLVANSATFLTNPIIAAVYLMMPYFFMIGLDLRNRNPKSRQKRKELAEELEISKIKYNSMVEDKS